MAAILEVAGPLRIVGPKSSFVAILMPLLDEFCRAHPGIQPDVQLDDGIGNWVLDRVDVGFRFGASPSKGVIGRQLFPIQMVVCAAPDYLRAYGTPSTLDDLAAHRCSVFRHPVTGKVSPWYLTVDGKLEHRQMSASFSTNDTDLEAQAVLAGQVMGQLSSFLAASHIRAGRLVPVLLQHMSAHTGLHVYYGSRTAQPVQHAPLACRWNGRNRLRSVHSSPSIEGRLWVVQRPSAFGSSRPKGDICVTLSILSVGLTIASTILRWSCSAMRSCASVVVYEYQMPRT